MSRHTHRGVDPEVRCQALIGTSAAAGELANTGDWRKREADADALFKAMFGRDVVFIPNDHKPVDERTSGWGDWTYQQIGAGDLGSRIHEISPTLREIVSGPKRSYQLCPAGSKQRAEYAERDKRGDDGRQCPWLPIVSGIVLGAKLQQEWDRDNQKTVKRIARELEAMFRKKRRERDAAVKRLAQWMASMETAKFRANAAADQQVRKRVERTIGHPAIVAAAEAARIHAANKERLAAARKAYQPPAVEPTAAAQRLAAQLVVVRAQVDASLETATQERAALVKSGGNAIQTVAAYDKFVTEGQRDWKDHGTRPMNGFLGYLLRQPHDQPHVDNAWKAANTVYTSARTAASVEARQAAAEERLALVPDPEPQPEPRADGRTWAEIIAPIEHRSDARKRVRAEAIAKGVAREAYARPIYDAMPDAEEVPAATMSRAKGMAKDALARHMEIATKVLSTRKSAEQVKHYSALPVLHREYGPDAQVAYADPAIDLTSPESIGRSFMLNLPAPRENFARLSGGKDTWARFESAVLSLPLEMGPDHTSNEAMVGGIAMRLRLVGVDVRERRTIFVAHRDKTHAHIHAYFDKVGRDGRVWGGNSIDLASAMNEASNLAAALFLKKKGETTPDPTYNPVVVREANGFHRSMGVLSRLADPDPKEASGRLRCNLVWQERDANGEYNYSAQKSPFHGTESDDTADSTRDLFNRKAISEALQLAGHVGIIGGLAKIDDKQRFAPLEHLVDEMTCNDDPTSWRYAPGPPRPITFIEYLCRKLRSAPAA